MSGFQEILLILALVFILFFLPRMVSRPAEPAKPPPRPAFKPLYGRWRLALVISAAWLTAAAMWLRPWVKAPLMFLGIGVVPVLIFWGGVWVAAGYRKFRR